MILILLCARVLLSLLFLVAGLAKLGDLAGSRQAMRDFGVPGKLGDLFGFLLPLAELATAVALVIPLTAWWGSVAALVLLLIFVAGIGYNLAHGRTPDCHCFGQLHSAPAGWSTLVRNLVLAGVAGLVIWSGENASGAQQLFAQLPAGRAVELLLGGMLLVVLLGGGSMLMQLMTQQGRLLLRIEALEKRLGIGAQAAAGLPLNSPAPEFDLPDLDGKATTLKQSRSLGKPILLFFTDPGCGPCTALLPDIAKWQRDHADKIHVTLVSRGTVEANRGKIAESGVRHVLLQKDREVAAAYKAHGTPSAVVVRQDGTIGSALAQGSDSIRALVTATLEGKLPPAPPVALKMGELAPDFSLPDLEGNPVKLSDYRGTPTVLLFWRPSCGFCERMVPDLKTWEANGRNGRPEILVISTDSAEANKAMGLRSRVVLGDSGMSVGGKFGATGTPMAVLVDAEGRIASQLVAGAPAVLELAGQGPAA